MVGAIERDETLGVLGRREDGRGMLDADGLIARRVHDQERLTQIDKRPLLAWCPRAA